ncbi:uncharacterized protein PG998_001025 [Apiospora kogelbergensis]|uniref:Uncharacterized protein n=1 Tax=Apiospora kogelbergensis TaxID=1337665 RepID=A0AAW0QQV9_9PEZI
MATRKVTFVFVCGDEPLQYTHDVPARLVTADPASQPDYREAYMRAVAPIMDQHKGVCLVASPDVCGVCEKKPATEILTTPMSYLHVVEEPRVMVLVTAICDQDVCSTRGQQEVSAIVAEVTGMAHGEVQNSS